LLIPPWHVKQPDLHASYPFAEGVPIFPGEDGKPVETGSKLMEDTIVCQAGRPAPKGLA
jgi:hypothetical protein